MGEGGQAELILSGQALLKGHEEGKIGAGRLGLLVARERGNPYGGKKKIDDTRA